MPTTVNGIGTHYYGKREVASRMGSCQHCGAQAKLESYTTRLWFVIVFIPIIPLKRVRLIDYCPRCSRHWAANPEQFEVSRQLAVSGAMERYREQPSVEAALIVHAQLLSYHMHTEADRFRESVLDQYADSAELHAGLASHLDQTGRWMEGTPLYEKALELKPDLPEVRNSLAWRRINQNKLDEAYELLDFLRQPGSGQTFNMGQLEGLAVSYQKAGNHERVIELCEQLLREAPALGEQFKFRKLVTTSERALQRTTSLLPTPEFSLLGLFDSKSGRHAPWVRWAAFSAIASCLFAVGMLGLNEYRRTHRTLHVVNAFAQPVGVSIDGGPVVTVTQRTPISLTEGTHTLSLTGPVTDRQEIALHSGFWSRWTHSPIWIFNVRRLAAVSSTTLKYSAIPQPSTQTWLSDSELSYVPHVDYTFEDPPKTMRVEGKNTTITKIHVGLSPVPPANVFLALRDSPDQEVGLTFAEGHLERNPNDASLLNVYAHRGKEATEQRVTEFLKAGLWRKPISVVWHRAYQNQKSVNADEAGLVAEYDAQLQQAPTDAALLYLRGRIGPTRADQLKHFRLAHDQDSKAGWPAMALAYDAANRGAWAEAREWGDKAVPTLGTDPAFRGLWHIVRLAGSDGAALETEYRQQMQGLDYVQVMSAAYFLADVLASQNRPDEARQATRDWWTRMAGPSATPESLSTFDLMLDYLCQDVESFGRKRETPPPKGQAKFLLHWLLAIGEPAAAAKIEGLHELTEEWPERLALSLAYALAENPTEAKAWLMRACDKLREGDGDQKRSADLLQRDTAPTDNELDEIVLRITDTPLLLATLAQRFPDHKGELSQRAGRMNISRMPPYLLVKRIVNQP